MQNILVTGGAGFIGSNFIRYMLNVEARIHIINLDALTYAGSLENLKDLPAPERHEFVKGSISDRGLVDLILQKFEIDTIVHFAAESHVDRSILGPQAFIQTNIIGTFTLLEAARQFWITEKGGISRRVRFHHVSTDEVFGSLEPNDPSFSETTPYSPNSPYAASKASADHLVRAYARTYGLPVTITNCSNNYGPYQFPEKLIPLIILNALEGKSLPVYGDGQQVRDWLFVEDHCEAIRLVLENGVEGETYNAGGGNQPANLEIVQTICDLVDELAPNRLPQPRRNLITFVKDRPGHDRRYAMDSRKINRDLGWLPRFSLADGLRDTVAWYLAHTGWVAAIRQQPEYKTWLDKNYNSRQLKEENL